MHILSLLSLWKKESCMKKIDSNIPVNEKQNSEL